MDSVMKALFAAVACAALAACAEKQTAPGDGSADTREAVTDLVQRWSDAGEAQDWDAIAATYANAEGFAWIEQGEARYTDHAAIVAGLNQARDMAADIRNDVSNIVVTPLGPDVAAYRADYTLAVSAEAFSYGSSGVLSGVAVRRDGDWQFLQGSFSERPRGPNAQ
jgi:ABC-type glycerol-3-phosphate transport system substrate-binding protein